MSRRRSPRRVPRTLLFEALEDRRLLSHMDLLSSRHTAVPLSIGVAHVGTPTHHRGASGVVAHAASHDHPRHQPRAAQAPRKDTRQQPQVKALLLGGGTGGSGTLYLVLSPSFGTSESIDESGTAGVTFTVSIGAGEEAPSTAITVNISTALTQTIDGVSYSTTAEASDFSLLP